MSDRIAVMNARQGRAARARRRSSTTARRRRFVADFIGTTNLLRGAVERRAARGPPRRRASRAASRTTACAAGTRGRASACGPSRSRPGAGGSADGRRSAATRRAGRLPRERPSPIKSAPAGGLGLTVLAPKTGARLPVGSDVAVTWSPVRGARPRRSARPAEEEHRMTTDTTARGIDLERELVRVHGASAGITRRQLLERIGAVGAAAALAPIVAACAAGGRVGVARRVGRRAARPERRPPERRGRQRRRPTPAPTPRPDPREGAVRLQLGRRTSARTTSQTFEDKYGIKVKYDKFPDASTQMAKLRKRRQGRRLRRHLSGLDRDPRARRATASSSRSTWALIPNVDQPRHRLAEPELRPGQPVLDAELLVDDRASPGTRPRSRAT